MESFLKSLPDNFELHEFKLEKVLGQGGFGITYLALDTNLMQHVAIKEYYPREYSNRDSTFTIHAVGNKEDKDTFAWGLKRFLDEARVLAQLSHTNIISIKRFFEANGTAYLVMEYCDGKPLNEIIRDHGPLNESELNAILFPLLDGLEHVHEKAFLHRDIKPSNIFIRKNGSPVLLDFGAAKNEMTSHSKSVTSLATAGYAPFEQYSTKGKQGPWSDIYGLSATVYRAISGIKPLDAPDRMLDDTLEPAAVLLKGKFDSNLLVALDKALAIRPGDRPQTIADFRALIKPKLDSFTAGMKSPIANTALSTKPAPPKKTDVDPSLNDVKNQAESVEHANNFAKTTASPRQIFVIFSIFAFLSAAGLLLLLATPNKLLETKPEMALKSESKETSLNVTPVIVDTPSATSEATVNIPPKVVEAIQDKKTVPTPKPALSFVEIDRAIDIGGFKHEVQL